MNLNRPYHPAFSAFTRMICFAMMAVYLLAPTHDALSTIGHEISHGLENFVAHLSEMAHHGHSHHEHRPEELPQTEHEHSLLSFFDSLTDIPIQDGADHAPTSFSLDKYFAESESNPLERYAQISDQGTRSIYDLLSGHLHDFAIPPQG